MDKTFTTAGVMQNQYVDLGVLYTDGAERYFRHADRRIRAGYRAALETLSIPLPPYALRGAPGPNPAKAVKDAYRHDNPQRLPR